MNHLSKKTGKREGIATSLIDLITAIKHNKNYIFYNKAIKDAVPTTLLVHV